MSKYLQSKPGSIEEVAAKMSNYATESEYQQMFKKELEKTGKGIGSMTPAEKKAFFNKIDSKYKAKDEEVSQKEIDKFHTSLDKLVHKSFGHSSDEKKKEMKKEGVEEQAKNPYAIGMAAAMKAKNDQPPLKKSTITKAHDIAKSIEKDMKKEDSQELQKDKTDNYKEKNKEAIKEAKYPHKMYSKDGKEVEAKTPADHEKYAKMGYTHQKETHSFVTNKMNQAKKDVPGEKEIVDPKPKMKFKEAYKKVKEAMNTVGDATADQANQLAGTGPKENDPDIKKPKAKADTGSKATPVDTSPEVEYKN